MGNYVPSNTRVFVLNHILMKKIKIKVTKRENVGKKDTQNLRKQGNVPCVVYGGEENIHLYAEENAFRKIVFTPDVFLVELDLDGKIIPVVMKDIQFHPVTDQPLHIDFVEVIAGKPSIVSLPINISGTSKGVLAGGKLRIKKRYIKVKGIAEELPEKLDIDITPLKIGDSLKVRDLKYDGIELLDPESAVVVGIATSRVATMSEDEEGEESEEGSEESTEEAKSEE